MVLLMLWCKGVHTCDAPAVSSKITSTRALRRPSSSPIPHMLSLPFPPIPTVCPFSSQCLPHTGPTADLALATNRPAARHLLRRPRPAHHLHPDLYRLPLGPRLRVLRRRPPGFGRGTADARVSDHLRRCVAAGLPLGPANRVLRQGAWYVCYSLLQSVTVCYMPWFMIYCKGTMLGPHASRVPGL